MKRVDFVLNTPDSLVENTYLNYDIPHYLHLKKFENNYYVPLHYSDTFEMLIFKNAKGQVTVSGNVYSFIGNQLFVIPPGIVHGLSIEKCEGFMYVFKVQFKFLENYLNLKNIMSDAGVPVNKLDFLCPEFDSVWTILQNLIDQDNNIFARIKNIVSIFEIISKYKSSSSADDLNTFYSNNRALQKLIDWTNVNYMKKITLDEIADIMHLSKFYFCKWFKSLTNFTYINYLNTVRISHACEYLDNGFSVANCSYNCGFDSVSYFIQVFKKTHGCTPKMFIQHRI